MCRCATVRFMGLAFCAALLMACVPAIGQKSPESSDLPDAPMQAQTPSLGSVSGTVTDADGDAIAGATVTLQPDKPGAPARKATADGDGYFRLVDVPAGNVTLMIGSEGFATVTRIVTLHGAEALETPNIMLPVATADVDVEVTFSKHDQAEEDIKAEEHQRLVGFVPNFYVSYNWSAPALTVRQKLKLSVRSNLDPAGFAIAGLIAGSEQAANSFPGYGQGAAGFGKRYGATLADGTVSGVLGGAIFPILLHQDPRYFYKGTGSVTSRALYALSTAFICRGDNGKWQPNYSSVLADVATGAISNTYYPEADRNGWVQTIELGLLNAAEEGFGNLLQEFVFKRISTGTARKAPAAKP